LPIQSERGYLIPAVNTAETDYVACAQQLAHSIKAWHPSAQICLLTDQDCSDSVFDFVKILPHGDCSNNTTWKLSNDWQCFESSPFRQTIKLEADMIAASPVDHWWSLFEKQDLVISQGCRDFYDNLSDCRFYRKIFDVNYLPDVYNAVTYWRVSPLAKQFFKHVREIFENWNSYKTLLKFPDAEATTDVVYAMAAVIIGEELCTLPQDLGPKIVHMKKHIIPTLTNDWSQELIWENTHPGIRINTIAQWGFVHYHNKNWRLNE
jgi:hypothetical protein